MERRVYKCKAVALFADEVAVYALCRNTVKVCALDIIAYHNDFTVRNRLIKITGFNVLEHIGLADFIENDGGKLGVELCAVRAIDFITVVFCGVVTCRDNNSRGGLFIAHGKRKLGNGFQFLEKVNLDSVRGED